MTAATLERVAGLLLEDGGLLASALLPGGPVVGHEDPALGDLAASGPGAATNAESIALAVEAAYEGHLLHRGNSRLLDSTDRDLALLAGDRLYALSLATLAQAREIEAVRELADAISLCAQAHADGVDGLEAAAWEASATAIGWGCSEQLAEAKSAARAGRSDAGEALLRAARRLRRPTPRTH